MESEPRPQVEYPISGFGFKSRCCNDRDGTDYEFEFLWQIDKYTGNTRQIDM